VTLRQWHKLPSDNNTGYTVGVPVADKKPMTNPWTRKNILQRVEYWYNSVDEQGGKYAYKAAYDHLQNYAMPLSDIKLELQSYLSECKIKQKESKFEIGTDKNYEYYSNEIKAYDNVISLINEKIPSEEQDRMFVLG